MEENYPQTPSGDFPGQQPNGQIVVAPPKAEIFPYVDSQLRLGDYDYYTKLFSGDHFSAFKIKIDSEQYNRAYSKLRYVMVNFAGLISKIVADMLFSEPITVKVPDGDQEWVDAFWAENNLDVQLYESALSNSYMGDDVFKLRVGPLEPGAKVSSVIAENMTASIFFPKVNAFNVRETPIENELAWTFKKGNEDYLRKEIHTPGLIQNKVFRMEANKIMEQVSLDVLGANIQEAYQTGIEQSLIIHIPNWRTGNRYFGISDYYDLDSLFYAINNRMSKIDNILDKHSDPILMVPPGVLDEKGAVKKKALGVIEIGPESEGGKPEYVVWDASLENAFKQIEKLVEFMYMIGEVSPDVLGMGQGMSDSGRALKLKLMRTIAKVARKKLYYDIAIKKLIYRAQLLAKYWGIEAGGKRLQGEAVMPEIDWSDGLPIDNSEQIETETKAIDAGITSKKEAMMRVYQIDEETAEENLKEIKDETAIAMPQMLIGKDVNGFDKKVDNKMDKKQPEKKSNKE